LNVKSYCDFGEVEAYLSYDHLKKQQYCSSYFRMKNEDDAYAWFGPYACWMSKLLSSKFFFVHLIFVLQSSELAN